MTNVLVTLVLLSLGGVGILMMVLGLHLTATGQSLWGWLLCMWYRALTVIGR